MHVARIGVLCEVHWSSGVLQKIEQDNACCSKKQEARGKRPNMQILFSDLSQMQLHTALYLGKIL